MEIIISDNASTDATSEVCRSACEDDSRIRYLLQPLNIGAARNFAAVLNAAQGEYFLWLADDDWIDADYLNQCVQQLKARSDVVLVSGEAKFYDGNGNPTVARSFQIEHESSLDRVRSYYLEVDDNAVFYGVMRRHGTHLGSQHTIAADWYFVAALAARGKVLMLPGTYIHRSSAGASSNIQALTNHYRLKGRLSRNPYGFIARNAVKHILWADREFDSLPVFARISLALQVYSVIYRRFYQRLAEPSLLRDRLVRVLHECAFAAAKRLRKHPPAASDVTPAHILR